MHDFFHSIKDVFFSQAKELEFPLTLVVHSHAPDLEMVRSMPWLCMPISRYWKKRGCFGSSSKGDRKDSMESFLAKEMECR
jgi:hypothetical protein